MDADCDGCMSSLTPRMTPSQFIASRAGADAETICALLSDIQALTAENEAQAARIAKLEAGAREAGEAGGETNQNVDH